MSSSHTVTSALPTAASFHRCARSLPRRGRCRGEQSCSHPHEDLPAGVFLSAGTEEQEIARQGTHGLRADDPCLQYPRALAARVRGLDPCVRALRLSPPPRSAEGSEWYLAQQTNKDRRKRHCRPTCRYAYGLRDNPLSGKKKHVERLAMTCPTFEALLQAIKDADL